MLNLGEVPGNSANTFQIEENFAKDGENKQGTFGEL